MLYIAISYEIISINNSLIDTNAQHPEWVNNSADSPPGRPQLLTERRKKDITNTLRDRCHQKFS